MNCLDKNNFDAAPHEFIAFVFSLVQFWMHTLINLLSMLQNTCKWENVIIIIRWLLFVNRVADAKNLKVNGNDLSEVVPPSKKKRKLSSGTARKSKHHCIHVCNVICEAYNYNNYVFPCQVLIHTVRRLFFAGYKFANFTMLVLWYHLLTIMLARLGVWHSLETHDQS